MRWIRLFLLGLASIYPLYWMAQFALFFLPAALCAVIFRVPLTFVDISFLQASAFAGKSSSLLAGFEPLLFALALTLAIWYLSGDQFLTGGLAITILGQAAILPFLNRTLWQGGLLPTALPGILISMGLVSFGLYGILRRIGGANFVDRLALLSLLVVLPQAFLWLSFRMHYPFFGTRFLLMLLAPLYLGALFVSGVPNVPKRDLIRPSHSLAPMGEILASLVVTCLLVGAIGLTLHSAVHSPPSAARGEWQLGPS
jgi:hypothetical protein